MSRAAEERLQEASNHFRSGDLAAAAGALRAAAEIDPTNAAYPRLLADLAREQGDLSVARSWLSRAEILTREAPTPEALNLIAAAWLDLGENGRAAATASEGLALGRTPHGERLLALATAGQASVVRLDDLQQMQVLLTAKPVTSLPLEQRLTAIRRDLLFGSVAHIGLLPLIAQQCFINEYVWVETPEETEAVSRLVDHLETAEDILRLACYRPLGSFGRLPEPLPEGVASVVTQQVREPQAERALADAIPTVTPISNAVSRIVREMYEANPYPRWTTLPPLEAQPLARVLAASFPRQRIAPLPNPESPRILVAGCGTGRHALQTARRYSGCQVVALDLSKASLGYAARKARELGLANVVFWHGDLLEIRDDQQFDVIEAAGSLQAIADPFEGVRRLSRLLRTGGVFHLGLYSRAARAHLDPAKALARAYPGTAEGIRAARAAILAAPEQDPVRSAISIADFYSASMFRDLLMHVQEHEHDPGDLARMCTENGLRPLGFQLPGPAITAYRARKPDDPTATDLEGWRGFEADNPETFAKMYQLVTQKGA
jgi:SAM-dependent methyltransferase